jgi:hypothetical protein
VISNEGWSKKSRIKWGSYSSLDPKGSAKNKVFISGELFLHQARREEQAANYVSDKQRRLG